MPVVESLTFYPIGFVLSYFNQRTIMSNITDITNPAHVHHSVWRQHTLSVIAGNPRNVEYFNEWDADWQELSKYRNGLTDADWSVDIRYRIAPPLVTVTISYPTPINKRPSHGTTYWATLPPVPEVCEFTWINDSHDNSAFESGMMFYNKEDAVAAQLAWTPPRVKV